MTQKKQDKVFYMGKFYRKGLLQFVALLILISSVQLSAQHSVARQWNEALLHAIRHDFARPTVHARNLWHTSIVLYDSWALYTPAARTYFLGDSLGHYYCAFNDTAVALPANIKAAQEKTMSYAAYRLLKHRFQVSPGSSFSLAYFDSLFTSFGHDPNITSVNYQSGGPAELGNYLAQEMIAFGFTDSANEQNNYDNQFYSPVNSTLLPVVAGNPSIQDPNRWQPLTLNVYIDQSGNVIPIGTPSFLSPEWGSVVSFALKDSDSQTHQRNGNSYPVFHNLNGPPLLDTVNGGNASENYQWGFRMVSKWSSHLDTNDGVMWDISPASRGNVPWYPTTADSFPHFYDENNGGDIGQGRSLNPKTGQPYPSQLVPRGDYTRVLAEFWADGPDSETPPGHWFTILNYVNDQPQLQRKWSGQGPVLSPLEWDVKSYFTLAGALHDAAVASWGAKGWYDYIRPISALRYMADRGQSSDSALPSYHLAGIKLDTGFVELVDSNDALAGTNYANVGKIKIYAWQGPDSISVPATDMAEVGWILAENWWPYQRPSFVTPPFAGYVSGHSTFSRAAAEVLTFVTGDPYFPGGVGEFMAEKNKFLVFEEGPSRDVLLQWATYRDASDQCSLSRIWGGIHPPADDIPGRLMGIEIGQDAFDLARSYWENGLPDVIALDLLTDTITDTINSTGQWHLICTYDLAMDTSLAPQISFPAEDPSHTLQFDTASSGWIDSYTYRASYAVIDSNQTLWNIDVQVDSARGIDSIVQVPFAVADQFNIDMQNPQITQLQANTILLADADVQSYAWEVRLTYSEAMDTSSLPMLHFPVEDPLVRSFKSNADSTGWLDSLQYRFSFALLDSNEALPDIDIQITGGRDLRQNQSDSSVYYDYFTIDTENPQLNSVQSSVDTITRSEIGPAGFFMDLEFSEDMDTTTSPWLGFPVENPMSTLHHSLVSSGWLSLSTYRFGYMVDSNLNQLFDIDVEVDSVYDLAGNLSLPTLRVDLFSIFIESGIDLAELSGLSQLDLFPNPVHKGKEIHLTIPESPAVQELTIWNLKGQVIYRENLLNAENLKLSTGPWSAGIYYLSLRSKDKLYVQKFAVVE